MPLDPKRPFLISPPFGKYFHCKKAYSVIGSYTAKPRPGKWWVSTRPIRYSSGPAWWHNMNMPNPGIENLPKSYKPNTILSLAPIELSDWVEFAVYAEDIEIPIEFNLSYCSIPNGRGLNKLYSKVPSAIFKLTNYPNTIKTAEELYDSGFRYFHICGPTTKFVGCVAGAPLQRYNLPLVKELANSFPDVNIIGGGGICSVEDIISYRNAGAKWFSLSTAFFKPWRGYKILKQYNEGYGI